jgi:type IV pilus assembly protein PilC
MSRKELTVFTRQLAVLTHAGLPLVRALQVLSRQTPRPAFRRLLDQLADTIRSGGTLSDGMARHEHLYGRLYVRMVKAGEAGGVLDVVLDRLAAFLLRSDRTKARVRSALIYPGIVSVVAVAIVSALLFFVVPRFEEIFAGLLKGRPLPALTQALLNASNLARSHFLAGIAGALIAGAVARCLIPSPPVRRLVDRVLLRIPLFGGLWAKAAIARFARTFGTLLASGVPILHALLMARDTSGNLEIGEAIGRAHERVRVGGSVAAALGSSPHFPAMVTSMIEVGEETAALPEMLSRIADTYDDEVDTAVAGLTAVVEPVMIVLMALVVGAIVIALFLPLVAIVQQL